jgi:hypothetical protein
MSDWNIFGTAPESLAGLLGAQATQDLQKKAMTTGLINTALGYLVQPKNQNLGLGRIIGQSLMSGMQGAQGVYSGALEDWQTKQKIAELQRKQTQQEKIQGYIENIQDPNERLLANLAPEQYVAGRVKGAESPLAKIDRKDYTKESFNAYLKSGNVGDLETIPKDVESWSDPYQLGGQTVQKNNATGQIRQAVTLPSSTNVSYGAPVSGVDAQGNPVFFQPAKGGGAPAIIPGVTPQPAVIAAPTESQAKASAFGSQMQSASQEFSQLQKEGFIPGATTSQAQVELAGTPLRLFADPLAQRAQQSQAQWSEAYLRYKTGAAATEGEVKRNIDTYFPKIGETDAKVIEQKARMRKQAEQDVLKSAKPSTAKQQKFTVQDQQALDWANNNPTDSRAKAIKQRLGL